MFIAITSRIIAAILTSISAWVVAVAIKNYDDANCVLGCGQFWNSILIAGIILLGAVISASIFQLSKQRPSYVNWSIRGGGLIFFIASIAGASAPSFAGFFLAILALAMVLMIGLSRSPKQDAKRSDRITEQN